MKAWAWMTLGAVALVGAGCDTAPPNLTVIGASGPLLNQDQGVWKTVEPQDLAADKPFKLAGAAGAHAVFELDNRILLVIQPETEVSLKGHEIDLKGKAQIIVRPGVPVKTELAELSLSSPGAVLSFEGSGQTAAWTLVEGQAKAQFASGEKEMQVGHSYLKTGEERALVTGVAGFSRLGAYRWAGKVFFEGSPLSLKRGDQSIAILVSPALIFEGDQVESGPERSVTLRLEPGDLIRLEAGGRFTVKELETASQPLRWYEVLGKVRGLFETRQAPKEVRMQTVTAVVGIKGTDFELYATERGTEVALVEGKVAVGDANGKGEVLLKAGELTMVEPGKNPSAPVAIPPERLEALQKSAPVDPEPEKAAPPKLIEAYFFKTHIQRPDRDLVLTFDRLLEKAEIHSGASLIESKLKGDRIEVDPAKLYALAAEADQIPLTIDLVGTNGVPSQVSGQLKLLQMGQEPPQLALENGQNSLIWASPEPIQLTFNQPIQRLWLKIDGKEKALPLPKGERIVLSSPEMGKLVEGIHQFEVRAENPKGLMGTATFWLLIDKSQPWLTKIKLTPPKGEAQVWRLGQGGQAWPQINSEAGGHLTLWFNEPLIQLSLQDSQGELTLPVMGNQVRINDPEGLRRMAGGGFKLYAQDLAGNRRVIAAAP